MVDAQKKKAGSFGRCERGEGGRKSSAQSPSRGSRVRVKKTDLPAVRPGGKGIIWSKRASKAKKFIIDE